MSFKNGSILFSLLAVLILFNSFYIVDEREKAIVLQFGETVREDVGVGFHFKVPIIQEVKKFDARLRSLDEEPDRILTVESKYLLVDSFIKYKISDVLLFYKATGGSFNNLNNLLGQRTEFELKNQFGKRTVTEVVRKRIHLDAMKKVYSDSTKIMIDVNDGSNITLLPLGDILQQTQDEDED